MSTVKCVSSHTEDLADGRFLPVGEHADNVDMTDPHNMRLLSEGKILVLDGPTGPTKADLLERARELDIKGRSTMGVQELADAIAEAENDEGGQA